VYSMHLVATIVGKEVMQPLGMPWHSHAGQDTQSLGLLWGCLLLAFRRHPNHMPGPP